MRHRRLRGTGRPTRASPAAHRCSRSPATRRARPSSARWTARSSRAARARTTWARRRPARTRWRRGPWTPAAWWTGRRRAWPSPSRPRRRPRRPRPPPWRRRRRRRPRPSPHRRSRRPSWWRRTKGTVLVRRPGSSPLRRGRRDDGRPQRLDRGHPQRHDHADEPAEVRQAADRGVLRRAVQGHADQHGDQPDAQRGAGAVPEGRQGERRGQEAQNPQAVGQRQGRVPDHAASTAPRPCAAPSGWFRTPARAR